MTWYEQRVQEMAELLSGFPFDSADFSDDGDLPLVRIRDILSDSFETFVSSEVVPPQATIQNGDVVIGMDGDFNVVHWSRGPAALNQRLCLLRDNGQADTRFLAYSLPAHLQVINDLTYSTTVKHLSPSQVRDIRMTIPDREEQRLIAGYLDRETARIDALIEEQQRLIQMLRARRQAVIEHATATSATAPPNDWRVATLRRIGRFITGRTPTGDPADVFDADGQLGWARPEDLGGRVSTSLHLSELAATQVRTARDAVLVCCIGATVGKVGWVDGPISSNQQITAIEVAGSAKYWYYALTGSRSRLVALAVGNTIPILNNARLAELIIAVPPIMEQHRIAAYLDRTLSKIDTLIAETERFIQLSKERRSALITAAVTGQIDVREMV